MDKAEIKNKGVRISTFLILIFGYTAGCISPDHIILSIILYIVAAWLVFFDSKHLVEFKNNSNG